MRYREADGFDEAAREIADRLRSALATRGRADLALSGGTTPVPMFDALALRLRHQDFSGATVHLWQVDERVVPAADERRSWSSIERRLVARVAPGVLTPHPMPVEGADLDAAAAQYGASLPAAFDVVHLGLGLDGHTASLVPHDPVLDVDDRLVALTGPYAGTRRMTLTFRALRRARWVLWLASSEKRIVVDRLLARDRSIPAGRVDVEDMLVVVATGPRP